MPTRTTVVTLLVLVLFGAGLFGLVSVYRAGSAPVAAPAPVAAATAPAGPALATASTPLGTVVTQDGFTLYRFDSDTPKPPASACNGKCATTWPPVVADGATAPQIEGVDPALVGTLTRDDGSTQVTLNGWALYRFSGDTAPGETKGEGVGGTWHAIGVDGKPATASAGLATADTPLGTVLTEQGFTLYRFEKDTPKPPASNCNGACATTWPPVLTEDGPPEIDGVDPDLVGTVTRKDGDRQVTVNGWPLYRFSGDAAPGETKGEGVGGTWHAIGVDGKPVVKQQAPAPAPGSTGDGY